MGKSLVVLLISAIMLIFIGCGDDNESKKSDKCSKDNLTGKCDGDLVCSAGACVEKGENCSISAPNGYCEGGLTCKAGKCVDTTKECSSDNPTGFCDDDNICIDGECKSKTSLFRLGFVSRKMDTSQHPSVPLDEYNYYTVTMNGRKKKLLTDGAVKCLNESSCWSSPNMKYFLYLVKAGENNYTLKLANNNNGKVDFASAVTVTENYISGMKFFGDNLIFLKKKDGFPYIYKYNMSDKTSSEIIKYTILGKDKNDKDKEFIGSSHFLLSPDGTYIVFSVDYGYASPADSKLAVEVYSVDLTATKPEAKKIYAYARVNLSGSGIKYGAITKDNKKIVIITTADTKHRIHTINLDGSSLIDPKTQKPKEDPLGEYIGPLHNACTDIVGTQICNIESQFFISKDDKSIYFSGRVGKLTELSLKVNLYKFDIASKTLINLTVDSRLENTDMQSVVFNTELDRVIYLTKNKTLASDNTPWSIDLNSEERTIYNEETWEYDSCTEASEKCLKTFGAKKVIEERTEKELKIELLKP